MTAPDRLAQLSLRIVEARHSGLVMCWDHVRRVPPGGPAAEIACKGCGQLIRRLRPVRIDQKIVRFSLPQPNYAELVLELEGGPGEMPSRHVTHLCRVCADRAWPREVLEAFYLCDLAAWLDRPDALIDEALVALLLSQAGRHVVRGRPPRSASESPHRGGDPVQEAASAW